MIWLALPAFAAPPDWWFATPPGFRPIRAEPPALWAFGNEAGTALVVRWEDTRCPLDTGSESSALGGSWSSLRGGPHPTRWTRSWPPRAPAWRQRRWFGRVRFPAPEPSR